VRLSPVHIHPVLRVRPFSFGSEDGGGLGARGCLPPVNWKPGEDVIIAGSVSNDEARQIFGDWKEPKPYIRIVPQPH
jgi:hypothetical protein